MTVTRIPKFYRPGIGGGGPLRWQDDVTGVLPRAVMAFVNYGGKQSNVPPTEQQLGLVREYMEYYVNAPCWRQGDAHELDVLREKIQTLHTVEDLDNFIHECLRIGLDPL